MRCYETCDFACHGSARNEPSHEAGADQTVPQPARTGGAGAAPGTRKLRLPSAKQAAGGAALAHGLCFRAAAARVPARQRWLIRCLECGVNGHFECNGPSCLSCTIQIKAKWRNHEKTRMYAVCPSASAVPLSAGCRQRINHPALARPSNYIKFWSPLDLLMTQVSSRYPPAYKHKTAFGSACSHSTSKLHEDSRLISYRHATSQPGANSTACSD